ncbi:growth/differentiation factor 8 [Plakobranchus ocellatus]|uniref:Growth/differentiation factor 8 n=1 Tax=Plakobranchus ocellatus TaxID=259542 RepID=A0AAV4APL0_9GAST|nr:growth/differentiation factor 8 [Plakobranchus ocellatus]
MRLTKISRDLFAYFPHLSPVPVDLPLNLTDSVYFSPPVQLYNSKIRKAFLWLYIKKGVTRRRHITLVIERVLSESISSKRVIAKTIHSQKLLLSKAFGWKRVEFREMLKHWVRRPTTNYGLRIRALDDNQNNLVVLPPPSDVDKGYEPWLDTKILELRSHSRHRRSESLVCSDSSQERRCCRYPLEIGFVELGWEWVIAPLYVRADFCLGECHMAMMDDTPRSWMTQQLPGTGGVCCAPTRMQPLSLLYFDNDQNILYQILQNVKVTKCGCV